MMFTHTKEEIVTSPVAHPCLPKWRARIDAAERRKGGFTHDEIADAWSWDFCAVGEAFSSGLLRNHSTNGPNDDKLDYLGGEFGDAVESQKFSKAREIVTAIEARLGELSA